MRLLMWSLIAAICATWAGVCYDCPDNLPDDSGAAPGSPAQASPAKGDRVSTGQVRAFESRVVSLDQSESIWSSNALAGFVFAV
jgi:hypothetical protein